ncbi:MAG: hypothetical protein Q8M98_10420 [Candidatus Cloacimonadaceae bacterium]|nr:hypothetical protein [Candidatus Cloacimonadaceae bacterium]
MYRFGISYYIMSAANRIPLTGVTIRLVRPGGTFANGIKVLENPSGSGYYETDTLLERDWGFYEIWDNKVDPNGSFSGKTCTVGKLDARGLQNDCIYGNHILNGVVTGNKLANGSVLAQHLGFSTFTLSNIAHELQDQNRGVGDRTQSSPADLRSDTLISHRLDKDYETIPHIILTNQCNCFLFVSDIKFEGTQTIVTLGIGQFFGAPAAKYQLLALPY